MPCLPLAWLRWLQEELQKERQSPTHIDSSAEKKIEYKKEARSAAAQFMQEFEGISHCLIGYTQFMQEFVGISRCLIG